MEKRIPEILVCPFCKGKLKYDSKKQELICRFDKLAFPVLNSVPVMMFDKARRLKHKEC